MPLKATSSLSVAKSQTKPSFAILLTWPGMKNAEFEVVQRLIAAASNIGVNATVVDNDGYPLFSNFGVVSSEKRITQEDCDFVISLHFESPRLLDVYSYAALWNPPEFYSVFGYENSVRKLATHNDALSCSSDVADFHAANIFEGYGRSLHLPLPELFHSPPGPCLEPSIDEKARLFYIGMNWERITGEKGRFHDLLQQLEREDLIDIFGPEEFHGIAPWGGYKNYRGSIPFDGKSILAEINHAGVCLAFSSVAHQKSGIMSNRLFEGLAAGAAIIANPHPLIDQHFSDCVYIVDDQKPSAEVSRDVLSIMTKIRRDPEEALEKARIGQKRFIEHFTLEQSLLNLIGNHPDRVKRNAPDTSSVAGEVMVEAVIAYPGARIDELISLLDYVQSQSGVKTGVIVVCDRRFYQTNQPIIDGYSKTFESFFVESGDLYLQSQDFSGNVRRTHPEGELIAKALSRIKAPMFCIMRQGDQWFSDHLATLVKAMNSLDGSFVASSGRIDEVLINGKSRRALESLVFEDFWKVLDASELHDTSRFLFRTSLLEKMPNYIVRCLDGLEHRAICLWAILKGPMAHSAYATYLRSNRDISAGSPFIEEGLQVKLILDSVRSNPDWLRLNPKLRFRPVPVDAEPVVTAKPSAQIDVDYLYGIIKGGDGVELLASGFSKPESNLTWIEGKIGVLKFTLPEKLDIQKQMLILIAGGRRSDTGDKNNEKIDDDRDQRCTILLNKKIVVRDLLVFEIEQRIEIPLTHYKFLKPGDDVIMEIRLHHAEQIRDQDGRVVDPRYLGLWIRALGLETFKEEDAESAGSSNRSLIRAVARRLFRGRPIKA